MLHACLGSMCNRPELRKQRVASLHRCSPLQEHLAAGQQALSLIRRRLGQATEALQQLPPNPTATAAAATATVDMVRSVASEEVAAVGAEAAAGGAACGLEGMTEATAASGQLLREVQPRRRQRERTGRARASKARSSKRQMVLDSSDEGTSNSSSGGEDEHLHLRATEPEAASRRRGRRGALQQQQHKRQQAPPGRESAQEESQLQQRLQQAVARQGQLDAALEELAADEAAVAQAAARVQPAALEQDLAALKRLLAASSELQAAEEQHATVAAAQEALAEERYTKLAAALQLVNKPLSSTYRVLTGGMGDAYCSYSLDRSSLFREGVQLYVRPDQGKWRGVGSLSGGQQALVALALSFALQVRGAGKVGVPGALAYMMGGLGVLGGAASTKPTAVLHCKASPHLQYLCVVALPWKAFDLSP